MCTSDALDALIDGFGLFSLVTDREESRQDVDIWLATHPALAWNILTEKELRVLAKVACGSYDGPTGVALKKFDQQLLVVNQSGFLLGMHIAGWATATGFMVQTFFFIKTPMMEKALPVKGPNIAGAAAAHITPVRILLPLIETVELWVTRTPTNSALLLTLQVGFCDQTHTKTVTVGLV
ncbi:hypothetical protein BKA62DRAFT_708006 [Auriculariales sp. MPI-PUGE-AT-0066]|nr:hypothetical protein BKA62DRAFT_708006 [Auriculariales sp. MPI-PUGE-AT-0066]